VYVVAFSDELYFAPARRLLAMLRAREVSSTELTKAFFERIAKVNPKLNAIVTLCEDRALKAAAESDRRLAAKSDVRPLEGLPITIKDSISSAGVRSTDGMKMLEDNIPDRDAPTVARYLGAGAVMLGKTNIPEMAMDYDCDNPVFGATRNPWNLDRVPGGSSGGEAAALAAGLCALGLGSDYGGSIRVPAHFSGVVGLKPSWGSIPGTGHLFGPFDPFAPGPPPLPAMATIGPMARYVDDLTLAYNVLRGPDPSSPYTVPTNEARPDSVDVKKARCAVFTSNGGVPVRAEIRAAVERAGKALQKAGVPVDEATPPVQRAHELWAAYAMADGGEPLMQAMGDRVNLSRERLRNFLFTPQGPGKSAAEFFAISIQRDAFRIELQQFMQRYPIIIGPPFCITAFEHGALEVDIDGKRFQLFEANWPALWVNCAGLPGAVVWGGRDKDGLPIGIQVVGRAFDEETVLAVAKVLERELGGVQRPPV
jgi:Asp-tRNA(Asn)/Glu-tRNA(Gln) amidotransferase A subunit family amidase